VNNQKMKLTPEQKKFSAWCRGQQLNPRTDRRRIWLRLADHLPLSVWHDPAARWRHASAGSVYTLPRRTAEMIQKYTH
jgi:hypothetical protein